MSYAIIELLWEPSQIVWHYKELKKVAACAYTIMRIYILCATEHLR